MPEISAAEWAAFLSRYPEAHLLQTPAWGELKAGFGWQPVYLAAPAANSQPATAGAQVLLRRLPLGLTVAYIPKGPVGSPGDDARLWAEVDRLCRRRRAIFLKVEPDTWEQGGEEDCHPPQGFQVSDEDIQPSRTLVIDLSGSEEQVLGRMKQKTRYNIRLALKKEIVVRPSADLDAFHRMMRVTGDRDAFGVHSLAYYQKAYDLFHPQGACDLLFAEYQGQPVAAVMVFARGARAWYFYGASTDEHRERMPTYLLQWEAMRWARARGCSSYDLWGVPDADEQALEAGFLERSGGLWGVYRFKRGFGGALERACGPWDRVYNPLLYRAYSLYVRYRPGQ
ncbi:MAG: lipid II:glycine glycyltransferase FemX [Chloroflexota bacterium]